MALTISQQKFLAFDTFFGLSLLQSSNVKVQDVIVVVIGDNASVFFLMKRHSVCQILGSRKFVIVDFGMPVFLTDFFIPSVAQLASISIDVWLLGESVDGQRLLSSTEIGRRSIAVQDMQLTTRIRFMKVYIFSLLKIIDRRTHAK